MKNGSPVMTNAANHHRNAPVARRRRDGETEGRRDGEKGRWREEKTLFLPVSLSPCLAVSSSLRLSVNTQTPHNIPRKNPSGLARIISEATIIPVLRRPR